METNASSSSSSSSSSSQPQKTFNFDVFLSFRGEDTRNNFTGHLSLALRKIGLFNVFKDDIALPKGKDIGPELMKAIEDSQYAVVVLSENYATSSWCLKELAKIVECMGDSGRIRTIFYHVNPSHVRNVISSDVKKQEESSFWKALNEHAKNPSHYEYLESWRNALVKVANQSGHPVEAHMDEAIFIKDFVADISNKLGASIRTIDGLFGMTSRLLDLDSYVLHSLRTNNVCFIGIHGMGGIGKSTLARAYYKKMSHKFDGSSFLENVRRVCEQKANGLVSLQKKLLKGILEEDFGKIEHVDAGIDMIKCRLRHKKVLIVVDDVSKLDQLNGLVGEDNWFGSESIILVTTREESFLKSGTYTLYRAESLNPGEALQLFSSKAFGGIEPPKEYKELSKLVVEYTSYLPLALTVLGSTLCSKTTIEWESALRRLRKCTEKEIFEKLKISFDDLNEADQRLFLDIACFFNGFHKDKVIKILSSCDLEPIIGIRNLIDKSLLSINEYGYGKSKIRMHDLLQDMGKEIVRKESGNEVGRQSRIWDAVDLHHILENREGMNKVKAIVTQLDGTKEYSFEALSSIKELRLLYINGLDDIFDNRPDIWTYDSDGPDGSDGSDDGNSDEPVDCGGPELSYNLQHLEWTEFPYTKLPSSFKPRNLVQLKLRHSKLRRLWNNGIKPFSNLKVIDLSFSRHLTKFGEFTVVPNLEELILTDCYKLSEIHPSIKHLKKLILLNLSFCESLEKLPEEINGLATLQKLYLRGCKILKKLPDSLGQLKSLRVLDIEYCRRLKFLPQSISLLENIESVFCDGNHEMIVIAIRENIKCCFGRFHGLTMLDLTDCNLTGLEPFPEYFGRLVHLEYLDLSKNPFSVLPPGINGLPRLKTLRLEHCKNLRCLEAELLPSSLEVVNVNYCTSLASFLDPLKPCHLQCKSQYCLDCTDLVKRQDGQLTALASLTRFLDQDPSIIYQRFEFVVPQSDYVLPSWFINQSSTASITIKLDPTWANSELIGFAMVFCFRANSSMEDGFYCNIRGWSSKNWEITRYLGSIESRTSDHLFLLFIGRYEHQAFKDIKQLEPTSWDALKFSFFSANRCSSCGPCGVRLVYEEDIEELKEITSKYNNDQKDVQSSH